MQRVVRIGNTYVTVRKKNLKYFSLTKQLGFQIHMITCSIVKEVNCYQKLNGVVTKGSDNKFSNFVF